jgi:hypothetical protein
MLALELGHALLALCGAREHGLGGGAAHGLIVVMILFILCLSKLFYLSQSLVGLPHLLCTSLDRMKSRL